MLRFFKRDYLSLFFWACAVGCYFLQVPFSFLTSLIAPFLFLFFLAQIPNLQFPKSKIYAIGILIYLSFLLFAFVRSLVIGIDFMRVFRFFVILISIPLFCLIKDPNFETKRKIFLFFAFGKSLMLIFFSVTMIVSREFQLFRAWAYAGNYGDIYLLHGLPYVQLHGNALLLVAFILDFSREKKLTLINVVLLLGVLSAGNFAFILGLGAFLLWKGAVKGVEIIKKHKYGKYVVLAILLVVLVVSVPYAVLKFQEKIENSNATRRDQAKILLDTNWGVGNGLGTYIKADTPTRNYDGDTYFELQTLYIFNQVGIVCLLLFYFVTIFPMGYKGKDMLLLYLLYLFYTFWNPYCFDLTHMISVVLILNIENLGVTNENSTYHRILPIGKSISERR